MKCTSRSKWVDDPVEVGDVREVPRLIGGGRVLADTAAGVARQSEAGIRVIHSAGRLVAHRSLGVEERGEAVVHECLEAVAGVGNVAAGRLESSTLAVVHAGLELEAGVTVAGAHERARTGSPIAIRIREAGLVQ